jgi:hypothetical protein
MTTYHTFNAPPAPSDFELAAADRRLTFNQFTHMRGIATDRERFHDWTVQNLAARAKSDGTYQRIRLNRATWEFYYTAFCQLEDARDLAETQSDALL